MLQMRGPVLHPDLQGVGLIKADQGDSAWSFLFQGSAHQKADGIIQRGPLAGKGIHHRRHWHVDAPSRPQVAPTARAVATPSTVIFGSNASPAPQRMTKAEVPRLGLTCRSAPGRQSPTARPASRPARQGPAQGAPSRHSPVSSAPPGPTRPRPAPITDARGDGDHVLQRPAQFGPVHVVGAVKPQGRGGQQRACRPSPPLRRGQRQRRRQASRDVDGKAGPGQDRAPWPPDATTAISATGPRQRFKIHPLAAGDQRLRAASLRPRASRSPPSACIGTASSSASARSQRIADRSRMYRDVLRQIDARQRSLVPARGRIDCTCAGSRAHRRTDAPVACQRDRQRRAEGAAADRCRSCLGPLLARPEHAPAPSRPAASAAGRSKLGEASIPARNRSIPAQAIIAALSVQSASGGAMNAHAAFSAERQSLTRRG